MSAKAKAEASAPRLKLVIRRLPPTLPEEVFWKSVSPWLSESTCTWKRFIRGRAVSGLYDHAVHSRAYCLMTDTEALVNFHRGFDGHVFRSKTGVEYQAVVEYAPVQKTPLKTKAKNDARQGTIDDDPDYKSYLESLKAPQSKPTLEPTLPASQPTTTPLLDHLRAQGIRSKKKPKTESSSTDIARNAVAALSASAARRVPKDQGPAMVAGKGREVVVAPNADTPVSGGSGGEKTGKSRNKKNKENKEKVKAEASVPPPTAKNFPALSSAGTSGQSQSAQPAKPTPTQPIILTKPQIPASNKPGTAKVPSNHHHVTGNGRTTPTPLSPRLAGSPGREGTARGGSRGRGRGDGIEVGRGRGRGGMISVSGVGGDGQGSRGGQAGGDVSSRGRGRGGADRGRNARDTVTSILTRNAIGDRGGRGGRGRGGGAGGSGGAAGDGAGQGGPATDPRTARIDA